MSDHSVRLGHVQLRVRDLDRSRAFYEGLLGLPVRESGRGVIFSAANPAIINWRCTWLGTGRLRAHLWASDCLTSASRRKARERGCDSTGRWLMRVFA
jgi:hypothetical protein